MDTVKTTTNETHPVSLTGGKIMSTREHVNVMANLDPELNRRYPRVRGDVVEHLRSCVEATLDAMQIGFRDRIELITICPDYLERGMYYFTVWGAPRT